MNVSTVTNHFSTANKGFITTLGSSILSGATTIPLTSVSGLTNGTIFVGIIEPGLSNEQEFTGTVDTAGVQITGVKWTDGTDVDHTAGVTIVDYVAATDWNMNTKGLLVSHDQDGTLKAGAVDVAGVLASNVVTYPKLESELQGGWNSTSALPAISAVVANGNRSYTLTHASSIASVVSAGMRRRFTRTVAANTYMGGAFNGSSHYFTKTSPSGTLGTVTNNFTIETFMSPTSYAAGYACGRVDGTVANGFAFGQTASGQVEFLIRNAGVGNSRSVVTYPSLPLNKKTHVSASMTGATILIYFDGVAVPTATTTAGTAPTTAGTGGDFSIGRAGAYAGLYFPGYISNVAVFDAVLSAATIKDHSTYKLLGSETNCIGAWSLDNAATDQSSAGNNLTATGGVGYTNISPFGNNGVTNNLEYGLTMSVSSDGLTEVVQCPEGCALPTTGGITASAYSSMGNPFGWVSDKGRWLVESRYNARSTQTSPAALTPYNLGERLTIPAGSFNVGYKIHPYATAGSGSINIRTDLNTASATIAATSPFIAYGIYTNPATEAGGETKVEYPLTLSAQTTYYLNAVVGFTGASGTMSLIHDLAAGNIYAIPSGL